MTDTSYAAGTRVSVTTHNGHIGDGTVIDHDGRRGIEIRVALDNGGTFGFSARELAEIATDTS